MLLCVLASSAPLQAVSREIRDRGVGGGLSHYKGALIIVSRETETRVPLGRALSAVSREIRAGVSRGRPLIAVSRETPPRPAEALLQVRSTGARGCVRQERCVLLFGLLGRLRGDKSSCGLTAPASSFRLSGAQRAARRATFPPGTPGSGKAAPAPPSLRISCTRTLSAQASPPSPPGSGRGRHDATEREAGGAPLVGARRRPTVPRGRRAAWGPVGTNGRPGCQGEYWAPRYARISDERSMLLWHKCVPGVVYFTWLVG